MMRRIASSVTATALLAIILGSCAGKQKGPQVAEGHKLCKYCCTTANIDCSCEVLDVVECPGPEETGKLPACAECRSCSKSIGPNESCSAE